MAYFFLAYKYNSHYWILCREKGICYGHAVQMDHKEQHPGPLSEVG